MNFFLDRTNPIHPQPSGAQMKHTQITLGGGGTSYELTAASLERQAQNERKKKECTKDEKTSCANKPDD